MDNHRRYRISGMLPLSRRKNLFLCSSLVAVMRAPKLPTRKGNEAKFLSLPDSWGHQICGNDHLAGRMHPPSSWSLPWEWTSGPRSREGGSHRPPAALPRASTWPTPLVLHAGITPFDLHVGFKTAFCGLETSRTPLTYLAQLDLLRDRKWHGCDVSSASSLRIIQ